MVYNIGYKNLSLQYFGAINFVPFLLVSIKSQIDNYIFMLYYTYKINSHYDN